MRLHGWCLVFYAGVGVGGFSAAWKPHSAGGSAHFLEFVWIMISCTGEKEYIVGGKETDHLYVSFFVLGRVGVSMRTDHLSTKFNNCSQSSDSAKQELSGHKSFDD